MAHIQLLLSNPNNNRVLASLIEEQYETVSGTEVTDADLYFVDETSLPKYQDALTEQKEQAAPVFCPVVLIRREQSPASVTLPDPATTDPPLLVNEILQAPVAPPALYRTLHNLLARRERTSELTADLRDRNERLERFSRALTHELRNPLQLLDGYLTLAKKTGDEEHFQQCESAVQRMETMINDTLLILRDESYSLNPDSVALSTLCEECWSGDADSQSRLVVDTDTVVSGDRAQLKRLFENLFRNAIEHNAAGVTITVGDLDGQAGFFVADDGKGIPGEIRDEVFDEGFSEGGAGIGLGLSVVRSIADAHGWEVTITESGHGGTRFEVSDVETVA